MIKFQFLVLISSLSSIISIAQDTSFFNNQHAVGTLNDKRLNEISGIAESRKKPGFFWMHNDSGDSSRFFLVSKNGSVQRTVSFNDFLFDCEDIASGIGAKPGRYVYLGDIGDNFFFRSSIHIYVFNEDSLLMGNEANIKINNYRKISLRYPDGAHDAETLIVDPIDSTLYVITKSGANADIYGIPLKRLFKSSTATMKKFGTIGLKKFTAGDISIDGKEIFLRRLDAIYYWKRQGQEDLATVLKGTPIKIKYKKEWQGEALCAAVDTSGFYTTSEGRNQPIFYFKKSDTSKLVSISPNK
jgi:hypothetical protein